MLPRDTPDLSSPRFKANPFPFYAQLRDEAPVFSMPFVGGQTAWLVTRYEDVSALLKDPRLSKDRLGNLSPKTRARLGWLLKTFEPFTHNMLDRDPPDHTRLRALVHKAFTPRLIEQLRSRIQTISDTLLDQMQRKDRLDLVADYALPLPVTVIAEMLGIPPSDQRKFTHWSDQLVGNVNLVDAFFSIPAALGFIRYLRKLIEYRRASPADDLISALIQAEEAGDKLTPTELLSMIFLLLVAGHETTVNLIASGTLALLQHPEQLEFLRQDVSRMPTAVEELLRYTSPVDIATERFALEDIPVAGTTLPRGALVFAGIGSANHDGHQFSNPDSLDLARSPNKHLALGLGIHYCLGAPLARLEGQIALQSLITRFPRLRLAKPPDTLKWRKGVVLRGLKKLPVATG